jgi:hypothetical protein
MSCCWIIQYSDFSTEYYAQKKFFLVFCGLVVNIFLLLNNIPSPGCITVYLSPAEGYLGCFQVWAIRNKATVNNHVDIKFQLFGYIPRV